MKILYKNTRQLVDRTYINGFNSQVSLLLSKGWRQPSENGVWWRGLCVSSSLGAAPACRSAAGAPDR